MTVGVEVDALALMLDGATAYGDPLRFGRASMESLERGPGYFGQPPALERHAALPEWAEVAEAILELEAWADWISSDADDSYCPETLGELGRAARATCKHIPRRPSIVFLEAAARLRDGWRPEGWRRQ